MANPKISVKGYSTRAGLCKCKDLQLEYSIAAEYTGSATTCDIRGFRLR